MRTKIRQQANYSKSFTVEYDNDVQTQFSLNENLVRKVHDTV